MFEKYVLEQHFRLPRQPLRFASIGAENCELEIGLARLLISQGRTDFVIECLELNPAMLARARTAAAGAGVEPQMQFVETDVNQWAPVHQYDAVLANQSLHHILNLEESLGQIRESLTPHGSFIVSDIIGRNGHLRWPEALGIVQEYWRKLPPSYRFNGQMRRFEGLYENWDCSAEGFEGIRSQDILPLLLAHFNFRFFVGFGNVIDPFVDRAFGGNFDPDASWDRALIDEVHRRDEREIRAGNITPTHMLAVLGEPSGDTAPIYDPRDPVFCVRAPAEQDQTEILAGFCAHDWSWPHDKRKEIEAVCGRLTETERMIQLQTEKIRSLEKDLMERTEWAFRLEREFSERTEWALRLNRECAELAVRARQIDEELSERTSWALQLDCELQRARAQQPPELAGKLFCRLREWKVRLNAVANRPR
jgi:SAM-dependent methyltransferase